MGEPMFKLVAATTDEFIPGIYREFVRWTNRVAWFAGGLLVDPDLAGHDGAFGLFTAFTESTLHQRLVQSSHEPSVENAAGAGKLSRPAGKRFSLGTSPAWPP